MTVYYQKGDWASRPWGTWEVLGTGSCYIVKKLVILPGESVSLQLHRRRNEHWVIVQGTATVTLGEEIKTVYQDESVYIPREMKHRIANQTSESLILIEVQTGDDLSETDIIRFEDKYGRISN